MKILEVFTKDYIEETEYRDFIEKHVDSFKLKLCNYDIEKRINKLKESNYDSEFKVKEKIRKEIKKNR